MSKIEIVISKGNSVGDLIRYLQGWCYGRNPLGKEEDEIVNLSIDGETIFSSRISVLED